MNALTAGMAGHRDYYSESGELEVIGYVGGLSKAAVLGFRSAEHAAGYVREHAV